MSPTYVLALIVFYAVLSVVGLVSAFRELRGKLRK